MNLSLSNRSSSRLFRQGVSLVILFVFAFQFVIPVPYALAAGRRPVPGLPAPGQALSLTAAYEPALIKGMTVHPENPLLFDFIVDPGASGLTGPVLNQETLKMVKYFLASLTIPDDQMWVNLSPYEKDRIVSDPLGQTAMGRDLLAQDYTLKQLTSSMVNPNEALGEQFWTRVRQAARERFGTSEIPVDTFNKVWIVPRRAAVYENGNSVFVVTRDLQVMLEADYLALEQAAGAVGAPAADAVKKDLQGAASEVVREIVIPALEKEVNEGATFANLRQVYNAMILAKWYKENLRQTLLGQVYADQAKLKGVETPDPAAAEQIYQQYLAAFNNGVFNFIKEDYDAVSKTVIPRKYFSGGIVSVPKVERIVSSPALDAQQRAALPKQDAFNYTLALADVGLGAKSGEIEKLDIFSSALSSPLTERQGRRLPWAFPNALYLRGQDRPEWLEAYVMSQVLLRAIPEEEEGIPLETLLKEGQKILKNFGINHEKDDVLRVLNGLRQRGMIKGERGGPFRVYNQEKVFLSVRHREVAVWAKDSEFIKTDIEMAMSQGADAFYHLMDEYEVIANSERAPVEIRYPVLWAIALMPKDQQQELLDLIRNRGPYKQKWLANAIVLTLDPVGGKEKWLQTHAPHLVGRSVYMVSPEISVLKGGLGRVMQYHGTAAHEMGADLIFVEPHYRSDRDENGEVVPLDYEKLPIPVLGIERIPHDFKTFVGGKMVEFYASIGKNSNGIPVLLVRDKENADGKAHYVNIEYEDGTPDSPATNTEFSEFFSKAVLEVLRYQELQKWKRLGEQYKAPLVDGNDGQVLELATWRKIFYGKKEYIKEDSETSAEDINATFEIFDKARFSSTTHTYKNRQMFEVQNSSAKEYVLNRLAKAGVPEEWMWLYFRLEDDKLIFDQSSAGLRAADFTKGVSAIHAFEMNPRDPGINLVGITNGDNRLYSREFFAAALSEAGAKDTEYPSAEEVLKAKAIAKGWLELNPDQLVVSYSGRLVPEKAGRARAFTDENIEAMVREGIQVVLFTNEQANNRASHDLARDFRKLEERINRLREEEPHHYPGRFVLKTRFSIDDQRKLLAAADIQIQDSDRFTGAAEYTEADITANAGLQMGPPFWEGIIQAQGAAIDYENLTGNTIVPENTTPKAYLDKVFDINSLFLTKKLGELQRNSIRFSRALAAEITGAAYLRFWDDTFSRPRANHISPRIAGEVSILDVDLKAYSVGEEVPIEREGHKFYHRVKMPGGREEIFVQVVVNLEADDVLFWGRKGSVPFDMVKARVMTEFGVEIPLGVDSLDGNRLTMVAKIPETVALPLNGQIEVTSGMWTVFQPVSLDFEEFAIAASPIQQKDGAESDQTQNVGGIDLNPRLLDMQISRDADGVPLALPEQPISTMQIEGFLPVIINVSPVTNLPLLLGEAAQPSPSPAGAQVQIGAL